MSQSSPWELLINLRPDIDGFRSGLSPDLIESISDKHVVDIIPFFSGVQLSKVLVLSSYDVASSEYGTSLRIDNKTWGTLDSTPGLLAYPPYGLDWGICVQNNHVVVSTHDMTLVVNPYDLTNAFTPPLGGTGDGYYSPYERISFETGVAGSNWPYVSGNFGAPVVEAHLGSVFFAGFRPGYRVLLNSALPAEQTFVPEDAVSSSRDYLLLGPQCIMWSDPDDHKAISSPNFSRLNTLGTITALKSYKDNLFIFTEDQTWIMSGLSEEQFSLHPVSTSVGCVAKKSVQDTPYGIVFLAQDGFYVTDGNSVQKISDELDRFWYGRSLPPPDSVYQQEIYAIDTAFPVLPLVVSDHLSDAVSFSNLPRSEYSCAVRSQASGGPDIIFNWSWKRNDWTVSYFTKGPSRANTAITWAGFYWEGGSLYGWSNDRGWDADIYLVDNPRRVSGERGTCCIYAASKPLFVEDQISKYWQGLNLVVGENPSSLVAIFTGEEGPAGGGEQDTRAILASVPDVVDVYDTAKTGTATFFGEGLYHINFALDAHSRYARFVIMGMVQKELWLRGADVLFRKTTDERR